VINIAEVERGVGEVGLIKKPPVSRGLIKSSEVWEY